MERSQKAWSVIVLVPALASSALFVYGFLAWTVALAPFGHGSVTLRYDVKKHDDVRGL